MGCEGRRTVKCRGARPWEVPGDSTAIFTAASTMSKPIGRGSGRDNGTRLWSDNGAIAALEFSQPSLGRRGTGTWRPGSGGTSRAAGERSGGAAPGPPGHQGYHTELEGRPGAVSTGGGTAALPFGAAAGGPTLPERRQEGGTTLGALPTRGEIGTTVGALSVGAAGSMGGYKTGELHQDREPRAGAEDPAFSRPTKRALPHHRCPSKDDPQERGEASVT